ncbi:hypothetical protein [Candidatus Leptofilum sp.]|uniref:hypothetical protein n=1 Tax=Candidatus Leptofilum sp. TaxID=3241576 RepID=UPI003B59BA08
MKKVYFVIGAVMLLVGAVFAIPALARGQNSQVADVFAFDPFPTHGEQITGAQAKLRRNEDGLQLGLKTNDLEPNTAVTIWWIIFNNPEQCAGYPDTECGLVDLENPGVAPEISYATGGVVNRNGQVRFTANLGSGHTTQEWFGNGLINPISAEVHVIVHSHGPVILELKDDMISTFRGGCRDDEMIVPGHPAYDDGTPGPNQCEDLQFAVFQP